MTNDPSSITMAAVDGARHAPLPSQPGYFFGKNVSELGGLIRRGELSCEALVQASLDSIARLNPVLNAFVHVDEQNALKQARDADRRLAEGYDAGPLHGIPVAIKDNIDTADMPTTYGSAHFARHRPAYDALCVMRLRQAGAIVIGKTLTHEFAYGPTGDRSLQGAARNPWDVTRMTGGSSAGSAAAVAAGLVPLAVGTDTGGSIRIPSAFCGAIGFKPTFDSVPVDGVFPLSKSLDHVGPIAGNVGDVALLYKVLSGKAFVTQSAPPAAIQVVRSALPHPLRIAWLDGGDFGAVDVAVRDTVLRFAEARFGASASLSRAAADTVPTKDGKDAVGKGASVFEKIVIDGLVPRFQSTLAALQRAEAYDVHRERLQLAPELFESEVGERLRMSAEISGWEYVQALRHQDELRVEMARLFEQYDLLLMPTLPITAPLIDQRTVLIDASPVPTRSAVLSLTSAWNVTGLPAISLPAGHIDGLPVGLQIVAAMGRDDWLLSVL